MRERVQMLNAQQKDKYKMTKRQNENHGDDDNDDDSTINKAVKK